jgi:hypothetical protein
MLELVVHRLGVVAGRQAEGAHMKKQEAHRLEGVAGKQGPGLHIWCECQIYLQDYHHCWALGSLSLAVEELAPAEVHDGPGHPWTQQGWELQEGGVRGREEEGVHGRGLGGAP